MIFCNHQPSFTSLHRTPISTQCAAVQNTHKNLNPTFKNSLNLLTILRQTQFGRISKFPRRRALHAHGALPPRLALSRSRATQRRGARVLSEGLPPPGAMLLRLYIYTCMYDPHVLAGFDKENADTRRWGTYWPGIRKRNCRGCPRDISPFIMQANHDAGSLSHSLGAAVLASLPRLLKSEEHLCSSASR